MNLVNKISKVLIVVEGNTPDIPLLEKLLKLYYPQRNYYIWSYNTNIYDLYDKLYENDQNDFETLDLLMVLRSKESNEEIKKKLSERYSDIILIFDFDPQDHRYSKEKIERMMSVFYDSTENGKLYLNYPMVEAFKHIKYLPDNQYEFRTVKMSELGKEYYRSEHGTIDGYKKYKEIVKNETIENDINKYTKSMCDQIIKHNIKKYNKILTNQFKLLDNEQQYFDMKLDDILNKQNEMRERKDEFYVLCTSVFYLLEIKESNRSIDDFLS